MEQLLCHLVGDYLLQTDWMASNKVRDWSAAMIHGMTYIIPFFFISDSMAAMLAILLSHIFIDHYEIAKQFNRFKNQCWTPNGFPEERPVWLTTWVIIIMDNTMHLLINYLSIRYL